MKKLTYLFLLLPYLIQSQVTVSGQKATYRNPYPTPIKVQVVNKPTTQQPNYSQAINQGLQNGLAIRNARAASDRASSEALKNNSKTIEIDKLKNTPDKYKYIAIKKISGWMVTENFKTIASEIINAQKYFLVNNYKVIKKKSTKNKNKLFLPMISSEFINNSEVLYLEWAREYLSANDRFTRLILKNSDGVTVYEASYKNKGYSEMLRPLLVDYRMNKTDVINKLMELKEYLDLGIITQEEFDKKAVALKKILLDN